MAHKLNILFIDDDFNVTNGIKRSLFPYRKQWDLFFSLNGKEGIKVIDHNNIDIVFCDIMMPVIDGTQVLEYIYTHKPGIVRFVLSGQSNLDFIMKSTKYAHQFFTKPSAPNLIVSKILGVIEAKKYLANDLEKELAHNFRDSPVSSYIYTEVNRLLGEEEVNSTQIADILKKDPVIAGKILQIANSGFFALSREITEIKDAVNYIGLNLVRQIVLFFSTFRSNSDNEQINHKIDAIAQKSLQTAYKMQYLCSVLKLNSIKGDDAFTCGLLHLLGEIVMVSNNSDSDKINSENVASYLISIWGLPKLISDTIAYQCKPFDPQNSQPLLSSLLYISKKLSSKSIEDISQISAILEDKTATDTKQQIMEKFEIDLNNLHNDLDLLEILKEF